MRIGDTKYNFWCSSTYLFMFILAFSPLDRCEHATGACSVVDVLTVSIYLLLRCEMI